MPGEDPGDFPAFVAADKGDTATAFYAWSTRHAAEIARLIGEDAAAERYAELSEHVVDAWRTEYVVDGRVTPHTQANLVRALAFDLVPDELRQRTADDLVALVRRDRHPPRHRLPRHARPAAGARRPRPPRHWRTSCSSRTPPPSWLAMIDRGATTVWERWEGIDDDGVPHESLNHYSKGAVVSFLHRYVAGLQRLEPTWTPVPRRPAPGRRAHLGLDRAPDAARQRSPSRGTPQTGSRSTVTVPEGTCCRGGASRRHAARARRGQTRPLTATLRRVTEYQVTRWRELPAMVVARAGDETVKAELAARFQEAIDEAAMRLGDTGAEAYLDGWERSPWSAAEGTPAEALDRVAAELDEAWPADRIAAYLDGLGPGGSG